MRQHSPLARSALPQTNTIKYVTLRDDLSTKRTFLPVSTARSPLRYSSTPICQEFEIIGFCDLPSKMLKKMRKTLQEAKFNSARETDSLPRQVSLANSASPGSTASNTLKPQRTEPYPNDDEAPPAYTEQPLPSLGAKSCTSSAAGEDKYDFLRSFDTVIVIDDSGSMIGSSWQETEEALALITPICTKRDPDGIDMYFINHPDKPEFKNVTSRSKVNGIFKAVRPRGSTPTGKRLKQILEQYLYDFKNNATVKPINIIVITDGVPSDDVESPIIAAATQLDKLNAPAWQVGIQFFQVGRDPDAGEHLKQLDDELRKISGNSELRDIVDTVAFTEAGGAKLTNEGILKVVLGSVN